MAVDKYPRLLFARIGKGVDPDNLQSGVRNANCRA